MYIYAICGRINDIKMREYEIIYQIRGAIYDTYNALGPGLLEAVYAEALVYFLVKRGLHVDRQVEVPIEIEGHQLKNKMRLDILVERRVIIEIKSVVDMREVFHLQLLTYLKLTKLHRGVLVNFNTDSINDSIWLKVNGFDSDVMLSNDKQEKIESD